MGFSLGSLVNPASLIGDIIGAPLGLGNVGSSGSGSVRGLLNQGNPATLSTTQTSISAPWAGVDPYLRSLYANTSRLPQQTPYSGSRVAPTDALTQRAQAMAMGQVGRLSNQYNQAGSANTQLANYGKGSGYSQYQDQRNPFSAYRGSQNPIGAYQGSQNPIGAYDAGTSPIGAYQAPVNPYGQYQQADNPYGQYAGPEGFDAYQPTAMQDFASVNTNLDPTNDPSVQAMMDANKGQVTQALLEEWLPNVDVTSIGYGGFGDSTHAKAQQRALGRAGTALAGANADILSAARGQNVNVRGQDVTQRGQDISQFLEGREQDLAGRGQDVQTYLGDQGFNLTGRGQDIDAFFTGQSQGLQGRGQDLDAFLQQGSQALQGRGQDIDQYQDMMGRQLAGRSQDLDAYLTRRAQDLTGRGQDLDAYLTGRGQDITGRGQDINAYFTNQGQNLEGRAQNLQARAQNINALGSSIQNQGLLADLALMPSQIYGQIGTQRQAQRQAALDAQKALYEERQQAPLQRLLAQSQILQGGPSYAATNTSGTQGNPNQRNQLMDLLGLGLSGAGILAASDRRLKRNVKFIGEVNGHRWYSFDYIWGGNREAGVMAQEVMKYKPEAVVEIGGFYAVDYSLL